MNSKKIEFRFSTNREVMNTDNPYNKRPTLSDVKKAFQNKEGKFKRKDGSIVFKLGDDLIEVLMVVGNSLINNRYSDIYQLNF